MTNPVPTGPPQIYPQAAMQPVAVGTDTFHLLPLSPDMDAAYATVYREALSGPAIGWAAFDAAVLRFLTAQPSAGAADNLFANATGLWQRLMASGGHQTADLIWSKVLDSVVRAELALGSTAGGAFHKGAGYYYWGLNALRVGDTDRGLLLMHEALKEDRRTYGTAPGSWPSTPAAAVATLQTMIGSGRHLASDWVEIQLRAIDTDLAAAGVKLKAGDIRQRFFVVTDEANVFLFVQAVAALNRIRQNSAIHRDNDFVGRLALGHLFSIAIVVERALAARTGRAGLFKVQAECLSAKRGGRLAEQIGAKTRAADINHQMQADADATLRSLLNATAIYSDGVPVDTVDQGSAITYAIRNLGAHHSGAPPVTWMDLDALVAQVLGTLVACIEAYY